MSVLHDVSVTYLKTVELARILRVHRSTVGQMATDGAIPGAIKLGGEWRFKRAAVEQWLDDLERHPQTDGS